MSITYSELLHGHLISDVPLDHQHNLEDLLVCVNRLRTAWGKPLIVTSGYRSASDQQRINPKVTHSKHMIGAAVDLGDSDGSLYNWAKDLDENNREVLCEWGLWFELNTKGWLHCQSRPYGSYTDGKSRFFIP